MTTWSTTCNWHLHYPTLSSSMTDYFSLNCLKFCWQMITRSHRTVTGFHDNSTIDWLEDTTDVGEPYWFPQRRLHNGVLQRWYVLTTEKESMHNPTLLQGRPRGRMGFWGGGRMGWWEQVGIDSAPWSVFTALRWTPANIKVEWKGEEEGGGEWRRSCNASFLPSQDR